MTDTMKRYGRVFARTEHGGWLEVGAELPHGSTAEICGDAIVSKKAAKRMHGGVFWGGEFWGGVFHGGVFHGGVFWGGEFWGGEFHGGVFWGGEFRASPSTAQRSDGYMFVAHFIGDDLRIWAGCRDFSWGEAISHWNNDHKHGAESQRIIHFLKAQAEAARQSHEELA